MLKMLVEGVEFNKEIGQNFDTLSDLPAPDNEAVEGANRFSKTRYVVSPLARTILNNPGYLHYKR